MLRTLMNRLRMRSTPRGVRVLVLGFVTMFSLGTTLEAGHTHDSVLDFAQCAVSHALEDRVQTSPTPTLDASPPTRAVDLANDLSIAEPAPRRTLPPATGPPATH